MPSEPKVDANDALKKSKLDGWISALIPIPKRFQIEDPKGYESDPRPSIVVKVVVAVDENWPDPLPLPKNLDPPLKLDPNILPNPLSDFCRYSAFENETAPEAEAGFLLSALGMVTGTRIVINPDPLKPNWFEYPIRSVALVMDISSNKTAIFRTGLAPLEKIQISINKNFNELIKQYEVDQKIFDKKEQGLSNLLKRNLDRFKKQEIEDELRNFLTLAPKEPRK